MLRLGLVPDRAAECARLFAETTRDGVYTHGLNRFPRFKESVANGSVDVNVVPTKTAGLGALERWDGHRGVGNLNAWMSMDRAIALAKEHGIGGVALANTNHWMRGGTYGLQAAERGMFAILLDQYAGEYALRGSFDADAGEQSVDHCGASCGWACDFGYGDVAVFVWDDLGVQQAGGNRCRWMGGFDTAGNLTKDAAAIEASQRALPVGYWKGSGLALVMDMVAAMLSGGCLRRIRFRWIHFVRAGLSQLFLAIDPGFDCRTLRS